MTPTVLILIQFFFDFVITAGGIVSGAMLEQGTAMLPTRAVWVLALVTGFIAASRRAQAALQPSAIAPAPDPEALVKQVVAAVKAAQPVTPHRVEASPPEELRTPKDT